MNLKSRKARLPIAALGACALVAGGGWLAGSAFAAPAPLTLNSGGDAFTVANLGFGSTAAANASYALKVSGADENTVAVDLETAPTSGQLSYHYAASNAAATTSFSSIGTSINEVQTVTITGTPTGGTFTLTYAGQTTAAIAYNATASTVQTALRALSNIGSTGVVVTGGPGPGSAFTVTFSGNLADVNVPQLTASGAGLTGGTAPAVGVTTDTTGGAAPVNGGDVNNADYVYVTGSVPGDYKFRLFQDSNSNGQLDSADERTTSLITMTVVDAGGTGTTATTTDAASLQVVELEQVVADIEKNEPKFEKSESNAKGKHKLSALCSGPQISIAATSENTGAPCPCAGE